jgi:hypothetical protein
MVIFGSIIFNLSACLSCNKTDSPDTFAWVFNQASFIKATILLIKDPNTLNNYIKKFKDKGVVRVKDNNYTLNNLLDPNTDTVEINLIKQ